MEKRIFKHSILPAAFHHLFIFLLFLQAHARTPIPTAVLSKESKEEVHGSPSYFVKIRFNSIIPSTLRLSKRSLSLKAFQQKSYIQISEKATVTCVSINNIHI